MKIIKYLLPLCYYFYKKGYNQALDDYNILHGEDARRFLERMNRPLSEEDKEAIRKRNEKAIAIFRATKVIK